MSLALQGRFLTSGTPGKPLSLFLSEDSVFGQPCLTPWPAHTPVILPSSFLSDPDTWWLRLPELRLPDCQVEMLLVPASQVV